MKQTNQGFYLKAPRFIDHHLAQGRSEYEVTQSKGIIKQIISFCVDRNKRKKQVIDLESTQHIEKAFIRLLAGFAQDDPNFIMARPGQRLYQRLLDNGFPRTNIRSVKASLVRA